MLSIVYFVFLISCSALAESENEALSVWWEPEMPSHSENVHSLTDGYGNDLSRKRPNIIFCCVCQEAIRRAKTAVNQKITKKINKTCAKRTAPVRSFCYSVANGYKNSIMRTFFPGGTPIATCRVMRLCDYRDDKIKKCN
ncbi:hypothetical protein PO909_011728 [Leuciscus waleckii]